MNIRYCSPPFKIHYMYYTISVAFRQDCVWQEKDQNEKGHALRDLFRFGSPARACTGMDIEPMTPCNNPPASATLRTGGTPFGLLPVKYKEPLFEFKRRKAKK